MKACPATALRGWLLELFGHLQKRRPVSSTNAVKSFLDITSSLFRQTPRAPRTAFLAQKEKEMQHEVNSDKKSGSLFLCRLAVYSKPLNKNLTVSSVVQNKKRKNLEHKKSRNTEGAAGRTLHTHSYHNAGHCSLLRHKLGESSKRA